MCEKCEWKSRFLTITKHKHIFCNPPTKGKETLSYVFLMPNANEHERMHGDEVYVLVAFCVSLKYDLVGLAR